MERREKERGLNGLTCGYSWIGHFKKKKKIPHFLKKALNFPKFKRKPYANWLFFPLKNGLHIINVN